MDSVVTYPIRAYLAGYDNSLEVTLTQADSNIDYICVEDIQGYSVSYSFILKYEKILYIFP